MTSLEIKSVSKNYTLNSRNIKVVDNVSFDLNSGEFISLIGPNGCGKSTIIKMIAGIETPGTGEIKLEKKISYLPQQLSLLPWKTSLDNLTLPLIIDGASQEKAIKQAKKILKQFNLEKFTDAYPNQLSGGMKQKLVLLRSIINDPEILLLDEPFSALDAITRKKTYDWLDDLLRKSSKSVIMVTHDIDEAIRFSDRIIVFSSRPGKVIDIKKINKKTNKIVLKGQLEKLLI